MSNFAHRGKYGKKGSIRRAYEMGLREGQRLPAETPRRIEQIGLCLEVGGAGTNRFDRMTPEHRLLHVQSRLLVPSKFIRVRSFEIRPGVQREEYTVEILRP